MYVHKCVMTQINNVCMQFKRSFELNYIASFAAKKRLGYHKYKF